MRTTINIDDQLLMYAKFQAAQRGCTLKQVMEDDLREFCICSPLSISVSAGG